jgi:hypothetical protein
MIDFRRWLPAQAYTMFAAKKVSERNENCRFQPVYVKGDRREKLSGRRDEAGIEHFPI